MDVKREIIEEKIKKEIPEPVDLTERNRVSIPANVIDVSSSDSDSDSYDSDFEGIMRKKRKLELALPPGFLDPLPFDGRMMIPSKAVAISPEEPVSLPNAVVDNTSCALEAVATPQSTTIARSCKQFWKAGDYDGDNSGGSAAQFAKEVGMDHVRVHPRFLHSNATSHKWALGAFAELLDNAFDEVRSGATYVHVDVIENRKDKNKMLLVEDNGGGMTPHKLRQCMSLGYSTKSKLANMIGQYGNGFKTSTMRLGADVIVFSRCSGVDGSPTQSIGMLSYTFLRKTCKEDIVVPMIDYERRGQHWKRLVQTSLSDWTRNLETILPWSPYSNEDELLQQFNPLIDQGTRIIIYNLWEDDDGQMELDFDADENDIQIRGVNRDEKKIEMAKNYPNSHHFLTYQHSLRSYASILYLRIPSGFQIILRGKCIDHHDLVDDMMLTKEVTYKPAAISGAMSKDPNMIAVGTVGFVKDAQSHIDIQGFNVYHKNRLIKPFWRVWNAAGSNGRGVIGVLEANFVEPAHDKQGFERTTALARLEARLVVMQKSYWSANCDKIGYAPRRHSRKESISPDRASTPSDKDKSSSNSNGHPYIDDDGWKSKSSQRNEEKSPANDARKDNMKSTNHKRPTRSLGKTSHTHGEVPQELIQNQESVLITGRPYQKVSNVNGEKYTHAYSRRKCMVKLDAENPEPAERSKNEDRLTVTDLLHDLEAQRDCCRSLEAKLQEAQQKMEELDKEQESLISIFSEERYRRDAEEARLRNKLADASNTIQKLLEKVKMLESSRGVPSSKSEC